MKFSFEKVTGFRTLSTGFRNVKISGESRTSFHPHTDKNPMTSSNHGAFIQQVERMESLKEYDEEPSYSRSGGGSAGAAEFALSRQAPPLVSAISGLCLLIDDIDTLPDRKQAI